MGSKRATVNTVIDLGGQFVWFACNDYISATYAPVPCNQTKCTSTGLSYGCFDCEHPPRPGCTNATCGAFVYNPFPDMVVGNAFYEDTLSASNDKLRVLEFVFACLDHDFLEGLAKGKTGILGLGRPEISFHTQVADKYKLPDVFSICLPSSGLGKLSIGKRLYNEGKFESFWSTPLILNPVSTAVISSPGEPSDEYFIDVNSIRVNGTTLHVKNKYFEINRKGVGGTKISTVQNYTSLQRTVYRTLTKIFVKAASEMKIEPFNACFRSASISRTMDGPVVPNIDLILPGIDTYWRINGTNALVEVDEKTTCLAFVDGGSKPRTSIVIGVHQLEETYLEFDLVYSNFKFSTSPTEHKILCSRL